MILQPYHETPMADRFAVVIPCGMKKASRRSRAADLYRGPYFRANLAWARSIARDEVIFILSAKHGLLRLGDLVDPYDLKMGQPGSVSPATVRRQAARLGLTDAKVYALGGVAYLDVLATAIGSFMAPMRGLGLGYAISAAKRRLGQRPPWIANYPQCSRTRSASKSCYSD